MKSFLCLIGIHDFERLSEPVPTKSDNEFDYLVESCALGRCRRCLKDSMIRCWGGLSPYHASEVKTKKEWIEILAKKHP